MWQTTHLSFATDPLGGEFPSFLPKQEVSTDHQRADHACWATTTGGMPARATHRDDPDSGTTFTRRDQRGR